MKQFWKEMDKNTRILFVIGVLLLVWAACLLNSCEGSTDTKQASVQYPTQQLPAPTANPPQVYLPPDQLQVPQYQQQPVIINQPSPSAPVHDSTMQDMLLGGLIGHAIGSSGNRAIPAPTYHPPQVVRQTVVRKVYVSPTPRSTFRSTSSFRSSSFSRRR